MMSTQTTDMSDVDDDFVVPKRWGLILALYLAGIAMGALDMGIVNPARTVIQNSLGVGEQLGVWVFTIYTLAYAAAIPIIGKVADLIGRKPVYVLAIGLFGLGSIGCGLAQDFDSFGLLLAARVVQAIGGGGMMPVATAAVGTIVPPTKRGMALGLVGMVYGLASVFGGSAGSLVLGIAGADNWQWIFYINVPIAIIVVVLGIWALPKQEQPDERKLDLVGIMLVVVLITSLLWAFQHLNFIDIGTSIGTPNVWVGLLLFLVLGPIFWVWETRQKDPVIDVRLFATLPLASTVLIAAITGVLMMTVMFIPQFAENSMRLPAGAGGYPTILIGLSSGIGAPISGKLTDKLGPRFVLGMGVVISAVAGLMFIFWASPYPGIWSAAIAIFMMGFGLGFLMGAPLTYLILHLVPERDSNSGQATLSLIRSLGTTLAPAILVGLLATAMGGLGEKVMAAMPPFGPASAQMGQMDMPAELMDTVKTADVTTIVDRSKELASYMFDTQASAMDEKLAGSPQPVQQEARAALEQARTDYLAEIDARAPEIETAFQLALNEGFARLFWFYTLCSLAGIALLFGIPSKRTIDAQIAANAGE